MLAGAGGASLMEAEMELKRAGSRPSQKGPPEWFTGEVTIEPLSNPPDPSRVGVASVSFRPGARTAWHTHPLGQTLVVTAGTGWTQCEGEERVEIRTGTSSGVRPTRGIGMARRTPPP